MVNKSDKATFASIQHSQAILAKLSDSERKDEKDWAKEFVSKLTEVYEKALDKNSDWIVKNLGAFEETIFKASDAIGLGNNEKFNVAMDFLRREILSKEIDKEYLSKIVEILLSIFQRQFGRAVTRYKEYQLLQKKINLAFIGKSLKILEEARVTEGLEGEEID